MMEHASIRLQCNASDLSSVSDGNINRGGNEPSALVT